MITGNHDIRSLPKWAMNHILDLERQIGTLREDLAQANGEIGETDMFIDMGHRRDIPVDPDASFKIGKMRVYRVDESSIRVTGYLDDFSLRPLCSNTILITEGKGS